MSKLTPEAAWQRLEPWLEPLGEETIERSQSCGRIIAQALEATVDVPPADVSAMDGYALASQDAPETSWPVAGVIVAGDPPGFELSAGAAVRIMTGAPVPATADRVIPIELTDGGRQTMRIDRPVKAGANIRRRAEVLAQGNALLPPGTRLTPGSLSLYATHGYQNLPVQRQPTVSILTTGDEVVPPEVEPGPGQLRDSHTDFLVAAGASLGLNVLPLGIAPDEPERLSELIRTGLSADVLLLGGGVSMGELDLVEGVLEQLGCEVLFDRVSVQPGKPLVAARHPGGLVFGLPGNPASVMATFWLFVRPTLRRLQGLADGFWQGALAATLSASLPGASHRDRFLPAWVESQAGVLFAAPISPLGSHDLGAWARGNSLVRVRSGSPPAKSGDACEILPLADWPLAPATQSPDQTQEKP
jgi:molybdopterin molybdotransferase